MIATALLTIWKKLFFFAGPHWALDSDRVCALCIFCTIAYWFCILMLVNPNLTILCMLRASAYNFSSIVLKKGTHERYVREKRKAFASVTVHSTSIKHTIWMVTDFFLRNVSSLLISQLIIMRNDNECICVIVCLHSSCSKWWEIDHTSVLNRRQGTIAKKNSNWNEHCTIVKADMNGSKEYVYEADFFVFYKKATQLKWNTIKHNQKQ